MDSSDVTDDVIAPVADGDDDDVNNPFYEPPSVTPTTSASASADFCAKFLPGTVCIYILFGKKYDCTRFSYTVRLGL